MSWFTIAVTVWIALLLVCWVWLDCSIDADERARRTLRRLGNDREAVGPSDAGRTDYYAKTTKRR